MISHLNSNISLAVTDVCGYFRCLMTDTGSKQRPVVGIDTGGTFTDFVLFDGVSTRIHKEPSTPADPSVAVLRGLRYLLQGEGLAADVIHGSTVGTNALLERKGARTLLVTTAGFEDVLEIGRQTRRAIYDINVTRTEPLVPASDRLGIAERVGPKGEVIEALSQAAIDEIAARVSDLAPDSIAICLLHSYANHEHESRIAAALRKRRATWFVSASHEVVPEFREFERSSTTVINAYVGPVMRRYLGNLETSLRAGADINAGVQRLSIMQSNGGLMSVRAAREFAVHTILSGPAGGAVGGFESGRSAGYDRVISFDMGGTSTDVSLAAGSIGLTSEGSIGELPVRVPIIDIHTVGAGGGSIAFRDPGGSLRVGPRSAGAEPGPICYGRGGKEVTVTDANLFLGRLSAEHFLGGTQKLDVESAREGVIAFAAELALPPPQAAEGILLVANATMERAIRVISLERGHDPRDFALVCFGGAGGMHAADLARSLSIPRVIVPPDAGILSALGMLMADFVRDYSRTLLIRLNESAPDSLANAFRELEEHARADCASEGVDPATLRLERSLDMRYVGQGYELSVKMNGDARTEFNRMHEQRYGYADSARELEVVNVRLRASAASVKPRAGRSELSSTDASAATLGENRMLFGGKEHVAALFDRALLKPGNCFVGPALVVEYSATTVVPPDFRAVVDAAGNLIMEAGDV